MFGVFDTKFVECVNRLALGSLSSLDISSFNGADWNILVVTKHFTQT